MKRIPLTQGKFALVDNEDFNHLNQWKWCYHLGYAIRSIWIRKNKTRIIRMHRVITNCPAGLEPDHRDKNGLNNQKYNLRICTRTQNQMNAKRRSDNISGYRGVSIHKDGHITVEIRINRKKTRIGTFPDLISAAKAYDTKAKELYGEFASLNFPIEAMNEPHRGIL